MITSDSCIKQRVRDLLKLKNSNVNQLSIISGCNQKTLNNQIYGKVKISVSTLLLILEVFQDINLYWIVFGEGDMLKTTGSLLPMASEPGQKYGVNLQDVLVDTIASQQRTIELQQNTIKELMG